VPARAGEPQRTAGVKRCVSAGATLDVRALRALENGTKRARRRLEQKKLGLSGARAALGG
jgi:hypothetical protein